MIDKGASPKGLLFDGQEPLVWAINQGGMDLAGARHLVEHGADLNNGGTAAAPTILMAKSDSFYLLLNQLLDNDKYKDRIDLNVKEPGSENTLLHLAVKNKRVELAKKLIALKGDDLEAGNAEHVTPRSMIESSNNARLKKLIEPITPAKNRAQKGKEEQPDSKKQEEERKKHAEDLKREGEELKLLEERIFEAIRTNDKNNLNKLLSNKSVLAETKNSDGDTPLLFAIEKGNSEIICLLAKKRKALNVENKAGSPLSLVLKRAF